jgi:hypothetical protein
MKPGISIALLTSLVCGFTAQTFVAWACFIYSDYTGGTGIINNPPLKTGEVTATGFVVPADWKRQTIVEWWGFGKTRETVSECQWMSSRLMLSLSNERQATYNGFSAGWPCRSLCGSDYLSPDVQARVPARLVNVPPWIKAGGYKVPVEPRWSGLLLNTSLYAAPFAGLLVVWPASRRARRLRRGECVNCGYRLAGLAVCPECGNAPGSNPPGRPEAV